MNGKMNGLRLNSLEVTNMRLIGSEPVKIAASNDKNVIVLLGKNGSGKTTVLDAIASTISPFVSTFPQISDKMPNDWDVHINESGKRAAYMSIEAHYNNGTGTILSKRFRKGIGKSQESDVKQLKSYGQKLLDAIQTESDDVLLPVLAYYGTGRGQIKAPERKRSFQKTFERWDCYKSSLNPATDFKTFFAWFDMMEDEERREREARRNFDYVSPQLYAVRNAIVSLMENKYVNPHIALHPLRFVLEEVNEDNSRGRQLRIEQMSDGYKIIIAMVADIAARMAEANPQMENPLLTPGIVLIDEIDLHLHPQWQRRIVHELSATFPNVQFIMSTHSPIIVAGAADVAQIVSLDCDLDVSQIESIDFTKLNIGQILSSSLFGLESLFSPIWDDDIKRHNELLLKVNTSDNDEESLKKLDSKLSGLSYDSSVKNIRANELLEKIANKIGVEL